MNTPNLPTRGGQPVRNIEGQIGVTTDAPRVRTSTIGVQYIGNNYPVLEQLENLTVIKIREDQP